ncbi:MAG: RNA methyltransferase [Rhodospirillales bacterium]|nr:RNA methyltransferase [Rhodospirillales bacterium]
MSDPVFILMAPQMGENIGAAARAMANFGLRELRLVAPRDGWPNERATATASGAFDTMVSVQVFETLADALGDIRFLLATTARRRDMVKTVYTPQTAVQELGTRAAEGWKTAILFGRERNGLENEEVARAQGIITVPVHPDFSSINLAQSVVLMAYEWFKYGDDTETRRLNRGESPPATQEEVQRFLTRLEAHLEQGGFFRAEGLRPHIVRNISNIFTRNELTEQEVQTLQGVLTALTKGES